MIYILVFSKLSNNVGDRSLFMEGGEGNFFFPNFLKLKAPPLKEQKFNDDPPAY
jgi:hypothetical protein